MPYFLRSPQMIDRQGLARFVLGVAKSIVQRALKCLQHFVATDFPPLFLRCSQPLPQAALLRFRCFRADSSEQGFPLTNP